jgi:hypothetical protein
VTFSISDGMHMHTSICRQFNRLLFLLGFAAAGDLTAQAVPCVTDADSASVVEAHFTMLVTRSDSLSLAKMGLSYQPPTSVGVVADEAVCAAGVAAHNALYQADTASFVSRAVVLQVGANRYVLWAVAPRVGDGRDLFFVFDTSWTLVKLLM